MKAALALIFATILALGGCGEPSAPDLEWPESSYDHSDKCTNAELVIAIKEFDIAMANQIEAAYDKSHDYVKTATTKLGRCYD